MSEIYDVLETCFQEMENGADVETLLARYSKHASELRPLLLAASSAQQMTAPEPSPEAVMRGRARLMQRVSELTEEKTAPRRRFLSPFFFRNLAVAFALVFVFAASGTGLVRASASALPGQNLYPVKRNWENIRLFFAFDDNERLSLEKIMKEERLHEVYETLAGRHHEMVDFSGVLTTVNGVTYVSNVPVNFPVGAQIPAAGSIVEVSGWTTDQGFVEVVEFELSNEIEEMEVEDDSMLVTPQVEDRFSAPVELQTEAESETESHSSYSSDESERADDEVKDSSQNQEESSAENQSENETENQSETESPEPVEIQTEGD